MVLSILKTLLCGNVSSGGVMGDGEGNTVGERLTRKPAMSTAAGAV
jgi:hypothetical protein